MSEPKQTHIQQNRPTFFRPLLVCNMQGPRINILQDDIIIRTLSLGNAPLAATLAMLSAMNNLAALDECINNLNMNQIR